MKIQVDTKACGDRLDCRVCLDHCPERVFGVRPRRHTDPAVLSRDWVIFPVIPYRCTGCRDCVDLCPQKAISLN